MGKGELALPLEMLYSAFVLQMLSNVSVDEVFTHTFEKML